MIEAYHGRDNARGLVSPEDIAWTVLANNPWPCTPQLVAHLTDYIKEMEMAKKPKPGKPKPKPGC